MKPFYKPILAGIFLLLVPITSAIALPNFIETYSSDPMAKIKKGDCTLCHESTLGGARNQFGDAFADNLHEITPLMRAQFRDYFTYPLLKVNDNLTIHFSDPEKKYVVVESNGKKVEVGIEAMTVDGKKATTPKE
jgi:hypothetical protein